MEAVAGAGQALCTAALSRGLALSLPSNLVRDQRPTTQNLSDAPTGYQVGLGSE